MMTKELLRDPGFRNGFFVTPPNDPQGMPPASMCWPGASTPDWLLRQWNSTSDVSWSWMQEYGPKGFRWDTEGKSIRWTAGQSQTLELHMDGIAEYGGKLRAPDAPWAHLLIEQEFAQPTPLSTLKELRFACQTKVEPFRSSGDLRLENWHTAQWQAFITIQNREIGQLATGTSSGLGFHLLTPATQCQSATLPGILRGVASSFTLPEAGSTLRHSIPILMASGFRCRGTSSR